MDKENKSEKLCMCTRMCVIMLMHSSHLPNFPELGAPTFHQNAAEKKGDTQIKPHICYRLAFAAD